MTQPAPPEGSGGHALVTLDGRYHIVERIAAGGMGEVFRAHDAVLAREVAIKVLHRSLAGDQAFVDRFRREARAAAGLSHPNVVAVYDWGAVDGIYYMVMEYVRGRASRDLLNQYGKLEPAQATEMIRQTLLALGHAHQQGLVHRDIKPENILITTDGVVKVTDFGLARAFADGRQTQAGTVTGTVQYLAPEQIRGEPADPRSDLYSLGIVSYELLTGKLPFTGETAMSIAYKHLSDRVPKPSAVVPSLPEDLNGFVTSATERDRELRPESAEAMRLDVEAIEPTLAPARSLASLVGDMPEVLDEDGNVTEAVAVATATATQTITRTVRTRRRRWRKVVVVVVALVALAATAWGLWTYAIPHRATVPPLAGITVDEARIQLLDLGFAVRIADGRYDPGVAEGNVLRVVPAAGVVLKEGETVMLVPSLGAPPVDVPSVLGKSIDKARELLRKGDLTLAVSTRVYNDEIPAGSIISQDPATGQLPQGSAVSVVLSQGPAPRPIPKVVGKDQALAEDRLAAVGFGVTIQEAFSDSVVAGRVISVSPDVGAVTDYGTAVTLTVSKGPQQFPVPDFRGISRSAAEDLAAHYGLGLDFRAVAGTSGSLVYSQTPGVGTIVRNGDTITLFLV
jgi:beta-lactam-binding protein with PASTA domain